MSYFNLFTSFNFLGKAILNWSNRALQYCTLCWVPKKWEGLWKMPVSITAFTPWKPTLPSVTLLQSHWCCWSCTEVNGKGIQHLGFKLQELPCNEPASIHSVCLPCLVTTRKLDRLPYTFVFLTSRKCFLIDSQEKVREAKSLAVKKNWRK